MSTADVPDERRDDGPDAEEPLTPPPSRSTVLFGVMVARPNGETDLVSVGGRPILFADPNAARRLCRAVARVHRCRTVKVRRTIEFVEAMPVE